MFGLASSVRAKICSAVDSVEDVPILLNLTGLNFNLCALKMRRTSD